MADDVGVNSTASYTVAADVSGTVAYQRVKIVVGEDGTFGPDVGTTTPLPVSGSVGVSGTVTAAGVSGTVTVNGTVTALGVSGTVSVANIDGQQLYTTAAPSASSTALIVILKSGPSVTIQQGASVSAVVSGTVTVNGTVTALGVSGTVTVNGTVTALGVSGTVSVSNIDGQQLYTTAAPAASSTALIVILKSGPSVTIQQGASVSAVVSGTVTVNGTVTALGVSGTVTVNGTVTALGVSGTVTINGTATAIPADRTTAMPSTSATGAIVWVAGGSMTQSVTVTVTATAADVARTQICIVVTSTLQATGSTVVFTVYQSMSQTTAGAGIWVVPAGKTFRVLSIGILVSNSVATTPVVVRLAVLASSATPTWTSTVPIVAKIAAIAVATTAPVSNNIAGLVQDVGAGVTVGIAMTATTATGMLIEGVVMGYLYP